MTHFATRKVKIPHSNARMGTLGRTFNGGGYGTVLLDGGLGGQSSYHGIDDYIATTGRNPFAENKKTKGSGLADRIGSKLKDLNITPPPSKPKIKNITMSF